MNSGFDTFDELFRSKIESKKFAFDEANWEKAEKMLDADRSGKKRKYFLLVFFAGTIFGVMILLPFVLFKEGEPKNSGDFSRNFDVRKVSSIHRIPAESDSFSVENKSSVKKTSLNFQQQSMGNKVPAITSKKEKNRSFRARPAGESFSGQNITSDQGITKKGALKFFKDVGKSSLVIKSDHEILPEIGRISLKYPFILLPEGDSPDALNPVVYSVFNSEKDFPYLGNAFTLEAGMNYNTGWNQNSNREGDGLNPVAGFGYEHFIFPRVSIHTGIRYVSLGNIYSGISMVTNRFPEFGLNNFVNVYTVRRLHYFQLPLQCLWYFNSRNRIQTGISYSRLFNTSVNVDTYYENNYGTILISGRKEFGYNNGYLNNDLQFLMGYGYRLSRKIDLLTEVSFGLKDIRMNDVFSGEQNIFETSTGVKLMIRYNILK